jgi:AcrR family transcriptional regulator
MDTVVVETVYNPTATKILHTAARLFMQRGYRAVSVNDIVHAAEVTKPTLYYHFADKEELFVQMGLQMLAKMHGRMQAALAGKTGSAARLRALAEVLLTGVEGDIKMMRREMEEHLSLEARQRMNAAFFQHLFTPVLQVMQTGLDDGEMARHNAAELTWLFLGMMSGFRGEQGGQRSEEGFAPDFSAETLVTLFLHGTGAPGGNTG